MAEISGVKGVTTVIAQLGKLREKYSDQSAKGKCVSVGFTAKYALFVHENLQGKPNPPKHAAQRRAMFAAMRERDERGHVPWTVGQPKFLEQPARELGNNGEFTRLILISLQKRRTLLQGLLVCGLRLQRESQILCPVDTSYLKASAFTRIEDLK